MSESTLEPTHEVILQKTLNQLGIEKTIEHVGPENTGLGDDELAELIKRANAQEALLNEEAEQTTAMPAQTGLRPDEFAVENVVRYLRALSSQVSKEQSGEIIIRTCEDIFEGGIFSMKMATERKEEERRMNNPIDSFVMRFEQLRKELFDAIDYSIKMDGHHKSYEGRLALIWPHRFTDEYQIELSCYVIGPSRGHTWVGKSLEDCLAQAEQDIRGWIKEDKDSWNDA